MDEFIENLYNYTFTLISRESNLVNILTGIHRSKKTRAAFPYLLYYIESHATTYSFAETVAKTKIVYEVFSTDLDECSNILKIIKDLIKQSTSYPNNDNGNIDYRLIICPKLPFTFFDNNIISAKMETEILARQLS